MHLHSMFLKYTQLNAIKYATIYFLENHNPHFVRLDTEQVLSWIWDNVNFDGEIECSLYNRECVEL